MEVDNLVTVPACLACGADVLRIRRADRGKDKEFHCLYCRDCRKVKGRCAYSRKPRVVCEACRCEGSCGGAIKLQMSSSKQGYFSGSGKCRSKECTPAPSKFSKASRRNSEKRCSPVPFKPLKPDSKGEGGVGGSLSLTTDEVSFVLQATSSESTMEKTAKSEDQSSSAARLPRMEPIALPRDTSCEADFAAMELDFEQLTLPTESAAESSPRVHFPTTLSRSTSCASEFATCAAGFAAMELDFGQLSLPRWGLIEPMIQ